MEKQQNLENKVDAIYKALYEIQCNQIEQFLSIQKNQNLVLKKLNKLQEYNEIDDMVNSLVDKRLLKIEQKLK